MECRLLKIFSPRVSQQLRGEGEHSGDGSISRLLVFSLSGGLGVVVATVATGCLFGAYPALALLPSSCLWLCHVRLLQVHVPG